MYVFSFEKLEVWKESILLVKSIYDLTDSFPSTEKFGLISQLRRASISISSNLAEGTSRNTERQSTFFYYGLQFSNGGFKSINDIKRIKFY